MLACTCIILIGYIYFDTRRLKQSRRSIQHVIHVNGIRGKSSVVWMLDSVFRAAGYRTFSKVTGTLPEYRDTKGDRHLINRKRSASISEQKDILHKAAKEEAEVLILECMAVKPEYQKHSANMLQANVTVITNVKLDHTEDMGLSREAIAQSLSLSIPRRLTASEVDVQPDNHLVLGTSEFTVLEDEGKRNSHKIHYAEQVIEVEAMSLLSAVEHPQNLKIVQSICELFNISESHYIQGIQSREKDDLGSSIHQIGHAQLAFGFAINDFDSSHAFFTSARYKHAGLPVRVLFNDRVDRPNRRTVLLHWLAQEDIETIYLSGANKQTNKKYLLKEGFDGSIHFVNQPDDLYKDIRRQKILVICIGNLKGIGEKIMEARHA